MSVQPLPWKPHDYQRRAVQWVLDRPRSGLFLEMGLGKTSCVLTALDLLMHDRLQVRKALVIAPLRVAQTVWSQEARKWGHLHNLTFSAVLGTAKARREALGRKAHVFVINRENVAWLSTRPPKERDFDMIIIDELSSFKNPRSMRFRGLRRMITPQTRVVGLTGTPAPNGYMDLWAQIFLLDGGQRLGRTVTAYRERYFTPSRRRGMVVYDWAMTEGSREQINGLLSDLCLSMRSEDYLTLPPLTVQDLVVPLPPQAMIRYKELEKRYITDLPQGEISAVTAGVLANKLCQMAGGMVYDENGEPLHLHDAKLELLGELIESATAGGESVLIYANYRHEIDRIKARFGAVELTDKGAPHRWNGGEIPVAVAHPASVGHGLNLQAGGHRIIWYSLNWSLELYEQANARLYRQGQSRPVHLIRLCAKDTIDERVAQALNAKAQGQQSLMQWLSDKINGTQRVMKGPKGS